MFWPVFRPSSGMSKQNKNHDIYAWSKAINYIMTIKVPRIDP